jgi:hypothetical protein
MMSELTPEQQERIRQNRERALAIQQQRRDKERELQDASLIIDRCIQKRSLVGNSVENCDANKKLRGGMEQRVGCGSKISVLSTDNKTTMISDGADSSVVQEEEEEEFEIGASQYVNKNEAMTLYCLPAATLAICTCVEERRNPRNASWTPMKLYLRSEIRQLAHKRYGGVDGLQAERQKRGANRLSKDLAKAKDVFKK